MWPSTRNMTCWPQSDGSTRRKWLSSFKWLSLHCVQVDNTAHELHLIRIRARCLGPALSGARAIRRVCHVSLVWRFTGLTTMATGDCFVAMLLAMTYARCDMSLPAERGNLAVIRILTNSGAACHGALVTRGIVHSWLVFEGHGDRFYRRRRRSSSPPQASRATVAGSGITRTTWPRISPPGYVSV